MYQNESDPLPSITEASKDKLLLLRSCTTESLVRGRENKLCHQVNGAAMGGPLGPSFTVLHVILKKKHFNVMNLYHQLTVVTWVIYT